MREVMISIKPKYCELICSGKKTVEVRKTRPKLETPFKVFIYQTLHREHNGRTYSDGKVIGEFVCDSIEALTERDLFEGMDEISNSRIEEYSCLSIDELLQYKGSKSEIYGWHISNLVLYDEPRELRDFKPYNRTEEDCKFSHLGLAIPKCKDCRECYVKRPYQSWGYVEATEPRQTAD